MYEQKDWLENRVQLKRRLLAVLIPAAILIAGIAVSLLIRIEWLTTALTIVCGGMIIFCYSMFISPVICYGRHLKNMLEGRKKETTGTLTYFSSQPTIREGVAYFAMNINVGTKGDEADDRLFYYDIHKQTLPFAPGEKVTVISHDKAVADIRHAS